VQKLKKIGNLVLEINISIGFFSKHLYKNTYSGSESFCIPTTPQFILICQPKRVNIFKPHPIF